MSEFLRESLDDRDFEDLLRLAKERARARCPDWDVDAVGDPGSTLLELFAYLTDVLLYRVNRIPEKVRCEFLHLLGLKLSPPRAASTRLEFQATAPITEEFTLPRGLRVAGKPIAGGKGTPPVFLTSEDVKWPIGASSVRVLAHHAETVFAEPVALRLVQDEWWGDLSKPPVIALDGEEGRDLSVALPWPEEGLESQPLYRLLKIDGLTHRILEERDLLRPGESGTFVLDRASGQLRMRPLRHPGIAADAPPPILRVTSRRGGGPNGNLSAGQLTRLLDAVRPGLSVTQPERATGGRAAETVAEALARGPREFRRTGRAVTADDYETLARAASGAVGRARAFSAVDLFPHAPPGTVDVFLVPAVSDQALTGEFVDAPLLRAHEREDVLTLTRAALEVRKPLGTAVRVRFAPLRRVTVHLDLVVTDDEDQLALAARVKSKLFARLQPLDLDPARPGWTFGAPLRRHLIDQIIVQEPGIRYAEKLRFELDEAPDSAIRVIAKDPHRQQTWIVGQDLQAGQAQGPVLFRSLNDGRSFEPLETPDLLGIIGVQAIALDESRPGWIAVVLRTLARGGIVLWSNDLGETWEQVLATDYQINDLVFADVATGAGLLLATDKGLYELALKKGWPTVRRPVDAATPELGFTRIAMPKLYSGERVIALAAREERGVYLAVFDKAEPAFRAVGPKADVRSFAIFEQSGRTFLWAGLAAENDAEGLGAMRRELRTSLGDANDWEKAPRGWRGGSCHDLAVAGTVLCAATHRAGVLRLDLATSSEVWKPIDINKGLGLGANEFVRIDAIAVDRDPKRLFVGSLQGLFRSEDQGDTYAKIATRSFEDAVYLPPHALFLSGQHVVRCRVEEVS